MPLHALPVVLFGTAFTLAGLVLPILFTRDRSVPIRVVGLSASVLIATGSLCLFGAFAVNATQGAWLPDSFEWPIGTVDGAIELADGTQVAPHSPTGRVQLYDTEGRFIRGWNVGKETDGGSFKLVSNDGITVEVFTARNEWHYVHQADGTLVSSRPAEIAYSAVPAGSRLATGTSWQQLPLTTPAVPFLMIFLGMIPYLWTQWGSERFSWMGPGW